MQTCRLPQPCWSTANTNNAQYLLPCEMCRASHHHGSATTSTRSTIDLNCRRERRDTPPLQHEQIENRRRKNKCANACTARTNVRKRESTIGMCDGDVVVVLNRAIEFNSQIANQPPWSHCIALKLHRIAEPPLHLRCIVKPNNYGAKLKG
ncbi:hypothetical protein DEO72_LG2g3539 [Vigna unguiculata]|uniref:Uncharacterized protein n=1 Tax=Vigna unguiculata TaxID=3917 RepID=A0A4D6L3Y5_VIGUN|nr:hypothetical protein DEO72_LG2g3539 [Vigna unguiculata]